MRTGYKVAAATVGICAAFVAVLAALIYVGNRVTLAPSGQASTYASIYVLMFAASAGIVLVPVMVAVGIADYLDREPFSRLYLPFGIFALASTGVILVSALGGLDLLAHDLTYGWRLTTDPDVRLLSNVLVGVAYAGLAWWAVEVLRAKGTAPAVVLVVCALAVAGVVTIAATALAITDAAPAIVGG